MNRIASVGVSWSISATRSVGPNANCTKLVSASRARIAGAIWPMWYSSQKMTNTRMSSRAASTAACCGERIGSDVSSSGASPLASTSLRVSIACGDAVLADVEVVLRQVGDRLPLAIEHGDVDAHLVGAAAEHRRLLLPAGGCADGGRLARRAAARAAAGRASVTTAATAITSASRFLRMGVVCSYCIRVKFTVTVMTTATAGR